MRYVNIFVLLCTLVSLGTNVGWLRAVEAAETRIDGRDGCTGARNGTCKEARTIKLLRLPPGFSFANIDLNLTREDFGGMTSFSDSELDNISGYKVTIVRSEITRHCETSSGSPLSSDLLPIIQKLESLGNNWCCQQEHDLCTQMLSYQSAASDICIPYTLLKRECIHCSLAGDFVADLRDACEDFATKRIGGFVRYGERFSGMGCTNWELQYHDPYRRKTYLQHRCQRLPHLSLYAIGGSGAVILGILDRCIVDGNMQFAIWGALFLNAAAMN
jgi:hypothetical protein